MVVRELRNENIDVINFTSNPSLYISRALSPAKISSINIDEETKRAEVYLKPDQVSLAIGKGGFNIKLAGTLTGYEIDVYRDTDQDTEDVDIQNLPMKSNNGSLMSSRLLVLTLQKVF